MVVRQRHARPGAPVGGHVVVCHDLPRSTGSANDVAQTYPALADRLTRETGLKVVTGTLRGAGRVDGDFSAKGWADDLRRLIEAEVRRRRPPVVGRVRVRRCALPAPGCRGRPRGRGGLLGTPADLDSLTRDPGQLVERCVRTGVIRTPGIPGGPGGMGRGAHGATSEGFPLETFPLSSGIKGGIAGGLAMVIPAEIYGIVRYHSIWYVVNLLGGAGVGAWINPTMEQMSHFRLSAFIIANIIQGATTLLVGVLYGALLPIWPRRPILLGGIVAPIAWTGLLYSILGLMNPYFAERIDWWSFAASQVIVRSCSWICSCEIRPPQAPAASSACGAAWRRVSRFVAGTWWRRSQAFPVVANVAPPRHTRPRPVAPRLDDCVVFPRGAFHRALDPPGDLPARLARCVSHAELTSSALARRVFRGGNRLTLDCSRFAD